MVFYYVLFGAVICVVLGIIIYFWIKKRKRNAEFEVFKAFSRKMAYQHIYKDLHKIDERNIKI